MSVSSYPFYSLLFKLSNKGMNFLFIPLKLQDKRMKEYSKKIFFISFHLLLPNETLLLPNETLWQNLNNSPYSQSRLLYNKLM